MRKKKVEGFVLVILATMAFMALSVRPSLAFEFQVFGKPLTLMGYMQQGAAYGINGDHFDNKNHFNQFLFQGLVEIKYSPAPDLAFFVSGKFNADWAYPIFASTNTWQEKKFDRSRKDLYIFDKWDDILGEAHVTWTPGNLFFRVGRQIVVWGQTDGLRLMDQINPQDTRRGPSDLQFEHTILPVFLLNGQLTLPRPAGLSWLEDLALQFIFIPNVEFAANKSSGIGGDQAGIWGANATVDIGGPYPNDYIHIGSMNNHLEEPSGADGMEYGLCLKSVISGSIITLNAFYGRENNPLMLPAGPPYFEVSNYDGRMIMHMPMAGFYPRFKFVGGTYTGTLEWAQAPSFLGSVAPVLRVETFYAFDSTFNNNINGFEKSDEFRWAMGIDWKFAVRFLNPKALFSISPQIFDRVFFDLPSDRSLLDIVTNVPLRRHNITHTLSIMTSYFNAKVTPMIFWMRDHTNDANMIKFSVSYARTSHWTYTLGAMYFNGNHKGRGFEPYSHKNYLSFTVDYKFE